MNTPLTLVILAAGRSTRFGRLKQLTPIRPGGEALLDYALHDGALAGFTRFVLVIQEDKQDDFDAHLAPAAAAGLDIRYVYQGLAHPGLVDDPPSDRSRPWGTGHAVLTAAESFGGSFALCNADDFYGREAFAALAEAMRDAERDLLPDARQPGGPAAARPPDPATTGPPNAFTVGYPLEVTLSESGGVSRGLCRIDEEGVLQKLTEGLKLRRAGKRVRGHDVAGNPIDVPLDRPVCMNLWGFLETRRTSREGIRYHLRRLFSDFIEFGPGLDREFYLTEAVNDLIPAALVRCSVLPTREQWLGVTFPDDHAGVAESLRALVDSGVYPMRLWDAPPTLVSRA